MDMHKADSWGDHILGREDVFVSDRHTSSSAGRSRGTASGAAWMGLAIFPLACLDLGYLEVEHAEKC